MYGVRIELVDDAWVWTAEEVGGPHTLMGSIPVDGSLWESLQYEVVPFVGGFYFSAVNHGVGDKWGRLYKVDVASQLSSLMADVSLEALSNVKFSVGCSTDGKILRAFFWDFDSTEGLRVWANDGEAFTATPMHFPNATEAVVQRNTGGYIAAVNGEYALYVSNDGEVWAPEFDLLRFAPGSEAYTETVLYFGDSPDGITLGNLNTGSYSFEYDLGQLGSAYGEIVGNGSFAISSDGGFLAYAANGGYSVVALEGVSRVLRNTGPGTFESQGTGGIKHAVLNPDGTVAFWQTSDPYVLLISIGAPATTPLFWTNLVGCREIP